MSFAVGSSSSSPAATPSEIGEAREAYLSSLRTTKTLKTIDWSKLLEEPAVMPLDPKKTRAEPSYQDDTVDKFLKRGPTAEMSQPLRPRPLDRSSDTLRLHTVQLDRNARDVSIDSDSLDEDNEIRNLRVRELSADDKTPSLRDRQEMFELENTYSDPISVSSTDPAARVLANIHTIDELEADVMEVGGTIKARSVGDDFSVNVDSEERNRRGRGNQAGSGRQSMGDAASLGYSEEDFESASEAKTYIEEEISEGGVSTVAADDVVREHVSVEEEEVAKTDTSDEGGGITESEEVVTEVEVTGEVSQRGRSSKDSSSSSSVDTERSDVTVIGGNVHSSNGGRSSAATSRGKGTRSSTPDGLGTCPSTPGSQSVQREPRVSSSQKSASHVGVQTDMAAQGWSCDHYNEGHTPIIPFVVGVDTLKAMAAYAPSQVALCNIMKAQLSLTRHLICSARQMADSTMQSLNSDYTYTTLKDTKEYIAKRKPRVLTVEEARQKLTKKH